MSDYYIASDTRNERTPWFIKYLNILLLKILLKYFPGTVVLFISH